MSNTRIKNVPVELDQFDSLINMFLIAATVDFKYAEKICRHAVTIEKKRISRQASLALKKKQNG